MYTQNILSLIFKIFFLQTLFDLYIMRYKIPCTYSLLINVIRSILIELISLLRKNIFLEIRK